MTMVASGYIELGPNAAAATPNTSIGTELKRTAYASTNLTETDCRYLGGINTGQIGFSNFYSKYVIQGQTFATSTSGNWTVPTGVYYVSILCIGAGGGGAALSGSTTYSGGGGALSYTNNIPVTPGEVLSYVAAPITARQEQGGTSSVSRGATVLVSAAGGSQYATGGQASAGVGSVKYSGGNGNSYTGIGSAGGGGAAGYSGVGGTGGNPSTQAGTAGSGGGGGGGGGSSSFSTGGGGGGVGNIGEGPSGAASGTNGGAGKGGSYGTDGVGGFLLGGAGGGYGGGGGSDTTGTGGAGLVRFMWGVNRYYPSTNTGVL